MSEIKQLSYLLSSFEVTQVMTRKDDPIFTKLAKNWIVHANKLILHRGKKEALRILKGEYLIAVRTALKLPFEPMPFRSADHEGFPKSLKGFKRYLTSVDHHEVQAVLTILRQYTQIRLELDYSTESITRSGVDISLWRQGFSR